MLNTIVNFINVAFAFLLPIIVPLMLGAIGLVLDRVKFGDMVSKDFAVRSKAVGIFVNRMVFGLFSFDLWVIIAFAESTPVSYFSSSSFFDKYAIAVFTLLLHLFTYIYTYTREFIDDSKSISIEDTPKGIRFKNIFRRDFRYMVLFLISLILCVIIRI
jgi:hypothetical protein